MEQSINFGVLDNTFLTKSVGVLNPPPAVQVLETASIREVISLLNEQSIGCVAVRTADGRLSGIFTERDVLRKVALTPELLPQSICKVMTAEPFSVTMTTPIAFVMQMMSKGGYRHMPIVDDSHHALAVLSLRDIMNFILSSVNEDIKRLA